MSLIKIFLSEFPIKKKCKITCQKSAVTKKYLIFGIKMANFRTVILGYFFKTFHEFYDFFIFFQMQQSNFPKFE